MSNKWLTTGFIFAALAIVLGAFAAHSLKSYIALEKIDEHQLQNFETAARYQMYHAFALMICGILAKLFGENRFIKIAALLFIAGIILFSGSLYLMSTRNIIGIEWKWLGPLTPLGGVCFIAGWILLAVGVMRREHRV
ncbi:MAG: DUF423 domain-containing protein [Bacteroidota bacterium]|nr:DUF423 domain-containing protein [Bacteroidota bacterium]